MDEAAGVHCPYLMRAPDIVRFLRVIKSDGLDHKLHINLQQFASTECYEVQVTLCGLRASSEWAQRLVSHKSRNTEERRLLEASGAP